MLGGFAKGLENVDTITKTILVAIAGGTASVLGGGKFANGAMSAAFVFMFNEMGKETFMDKMKEANKAYKKAFSALDAKDKIEAYGKYLTFYKAFKSGDPASTLIAFSELYSTFAPLSIVPINTEVLANFVNTVKVNPWNMHRDPLTRAKYCISHGVLCD